MFRALAPTERTLLPKVSEDPAPLPLSVAPSLSNTGRENKISSVEPVTSMVTALPKPAPSNTEPVPLVSVKELALKLVPVNCKFPP